MLEASHISAQELRVVKIYVSAMREAVIWWSELAEDKSL